MPAALALTLAAVIVVSGCIKAETITQKSVITTSSTATVTTSSTATVTTNINSTITKTTSVPTTIVTTSTQPPVSQATTLNGAGATFPQPLYSQWFTEYATLTGVKINYQGVGSGAGITAITNGTVDFGASDALLTTTQLAAAQAAYGTLVTVPMTADAACVVYNLQGITAGQLKLTGDVIAKIYLGTITKWNDPAITALNPGLNLPNAGITTVHRSDGSGTTNIFTNYLDKISQTWHNTVGTAKDNGYPIIESDVVVGCGARILGPVRVGARAVIGANAVVVHDVPPGAVATGIPAVCRPAVRRAPNARVPEEVRPS